MHVLINIPVPMGAVVRRRTINSRAYASVPYHAARMLNQLRRGHRAWPMFELKSGAAMAAPAAPMPPPLYRSRKFLVSRSQTLQGGESGQLPI